METFNSNKFDRHLQELACLAGARLVTATETDQRRRWSESRIKQLTGGDRIRANFMRQDSFEFTPRFKLLFAGNHSPNITNLDDAMRRRINIVPFDIKPAVPDTTLEKRLEAEWPSILRWAIDGSLAWQQQGLDPPPAVVEATAEYFSNQDTFGAWLVEKCRVEPDNDYLHAFVADLRASWSAYAEAAGEHSGSQREFGDRMKNKGFRSYQIRIGARNGKGYDGIELLQPKSGDYE
jgi:putative DNA primase/helicase